MDTRRSILAALTAVALAACGTGAPDIGGLQSDLAGLIATPNPGGSLSTPRAGGPGQAGSTGGTAATAPPAGPSGTIRGTIREVMTATYNGPDGTTFEDGTWESVVTVELLRAPGGDETYVDAGSSYSMDFSSRGERKTDTCTSVVETQSDTSTYKFTDTPTTEYENEITATVLRDDALVLMFVSISYPVLQEHSGCSTSSASFGGSQTVSCGTVIGLQLPLIEGSQTDQIDANCSDTGTTVTGTLTLTH